MPLNLIKTYNSVLDIDALPLSSRTKSLKGIFVRDFVENQPVTFKNKEIAPTPDDGNATMDTLFHHLTTKKEIPKLPKRIFDRSRSIRLHWVRFHLDEGKSDNMLHFTVKEPQGFRTYLYDRNEEYVIVLEPLRNGEKYYLLSAYKLEGKDSQRKKIDRKYKRKYHEVL